MRGPEIRGFGDEHVDDAAALLARRHARHRESEPLLPQQYEDPAAARVEIEAILEDADASGAVALLGGRVVGYLLGAPDPDTRSGPYVWVDFAGHAAEEAEIVRDLYAIAAERWLEEGQRAHYALVPASDRGLVDAWFRLGFGHQHAHGIREVPAAVEVAAPARATIRRGRAEDEEAALALRPALALHQARSPVFSDVAVPDPAEVLENWRDGTGDERCAFLLAEVDGRPVSVFVGCPAEYSSANSGLARPQGAALLAYAATAPDRRGLGIGLALTDAVFAWAHDEGYAVILTDWRVTNLLSSRFWPRRGFRTTFFRLHRLLA